MAKAGRKKIKNIDVINYPPIKAWEYHGGVYDESTQNILKICFYEWNGELSKVLYNVACNIEYE